MQKYRPEKLSVVIITNLEFLGYSIKKEKYFGFTLIYVKKKGNCLKIIFFHDETLNENFLEIIS